jgi:hypothetical protein
VLDLIDLIQGFVIASAILLLARWILRERKTHKAWSQIATESDLVYDHGYDLFGKPLPMGMGGPYRGRKISLAYKTDRPTSNRDYTERYIRVWIQINLSDFGTLSFSEENILRRISLPFLYKSREDPDTEFDRRFFIWSEPEDFAARVFSSEKLRQALLRRTTLSFTVSKAKSGLESRMSRQERDLDYWQGVLNTLCDVAEAVEGALVSENFGTAIDNPSA